jgi:hypothetical protein
MITSYNLLAILHEQIPEMKDCDSELRPLLRIFAAINGFADFTGNAIKEHHYLLAGRCFLVAEQIYKGGDRLTRSLIKYSFIPSLKAFMPSEDSEKHFIMSLIPVTLNRLYEEEHAE